MYKLKLKYKDGSKMSLYVTSNTTVKLKNNEIYIKGDGAEFKSNLKNVKEVKLTLNKNKSCLLKIGSIITIPKIKEIFKNLIKAERNERWNKFMTAVESSQT